MSAAALSFGLPHARSRRLLLDPILIVAVIGLLLLGLTMVTSASITVAGSNAGDPFFYLKRQLFAIALGLIAAGLALSIPLTVWHRLALPLLIVAIVLLVAVLIPGIGHKVNGSRRWLVVTNFQVSELARVLLLMYLASYIVRHHAELRESVQGFLKPLGVLLVGAFLMLLEPDMGAATVLLATGMGVLFVAGVKLRHFVVLAALGGALLALVAFASPYRWERVTNFLNPWNDPFGAGFQLTQSLIAIGRGEWFGVGLGASVQKLFYLPEAHTDFVFAVLAEELGLIGVIGVLALLGVLLLRALRISRLAADAGLPYHAFVAAAFAIWLGLQVFVNVGVNMGLLPTKGLTLPLLSYGRSSMLVTLGWIGLLLRIHHEASLSGRTAMPRVSAKEREA